MTDLSNKLALEGFNNLTKSLGVNIYQTCYVADATEFAAYQQCIDETYHAKKLAAILNRIVDIIGAQLLNIAQQDYEPQGASVAMLICEDMSNVHEILQNKHSETLLAHLDKSHITVHTYPDRQPVNGLVTFRAEIDVATCGLISPLKALDYLLDTFQPDAMTIDYRVRGFTRDKQGDKYYTDHPITSIQQMLSKQWQERYSMVDHNMIQQRLFHTKMLRLSECTDEVTKRINEELHAILNGSM